MTTNEFDVDGWVERLARALERLADVQEDYWDDIHWQGAGNVHRDEERDPWYRFEHFYWRASETKSRFLRERYSPVGAVLAEIRRVLSVHPAWSGLVDASCKGEIWFQFAGGGCMRRPSRTISGLMARSKELEEDGLRVACRELSLLLEGNDEMDEDPVRAELLTGYHVALAQGLKVGEDTRIGDEVMIMPLTRLDSFVGKSMLERLVPEVSRYGGGKSIAAIVKPFRWKPEFGRNGESFGSRGLQVGSFFEDAEVLIELLALFHGAPVVVLATVAGRLNRTACLLLGSLDFHQSYGASCPSWSVARFRKSVEAQPEAMDAARKAFAERNGERYRDCAPVITRLAEALARQGRFGTEDRILDVAIALERMYQLDQGEISYKLKTRAACFLEATTSGRTSVFRDVNKFYDARSEIVHAKKGRKRRPTEDALKRERRAAFEKGFDVARRSVVELLRVGPPEDWNEVLLKVYGNGTRTS